MEYVKVIDGTPVIYPLSKLKEDYPNIGKLPRPPRTPQEDYNMWLATLNIYPCVVADRPAVGDKERTVLKNLPELVGDKWTFNWTVNQIPASERYPTASSAKAAVNDWIDRLLSQITSKYPRHEIDSWPIKSEAARYVIAGTARADQTKMVQDEADLTGATLADQATLIVTKADQFTAIISLTSGLRQKTGGLLDAATTPEEFDAIVDAALAEATTKATEHGLTV